MCVCVYVCGAVGLMATSLQDSSKTTAKTTETE